MAIIRVAHLVVQLTSLPLDHLLHEIEISVQFLQEKVTLAAKDLLETCEVGYSRFNLLALVKYLVSESMFFLFSLVHDMTERLHVVTLVLVDKHRSLDLHAFLGLTCHVLSLRLLSHFDFHRPVAIVADRLLILEAVMREILLVFLACKTFNFYQVAATVPLDHKVILTLRMLQMFDLARVAE